MKQTLPYQLTNFQEDVLNQSYHVPVLVDYWASWCEPCKYIGPIIEKLANEAAGKWKLIKIDTEEHSEIAAEWGIRGIPNLKLFYKGKVIADLAGAMDEPEMRNWLAEKLPSEAELLTIEASELIAKGHTGKGIILLEQAIKSNNDLIEARLLLAKLIIWDNPSRVLPLVGDIRYVEEAEELILLASFIKSNPSGLKAGSSKQMLNKVKELLKIKKLEAGVKLLLEAISIDKNYEDGLARKLAITIFYILGEANAITQKYRRVFDKLLY